MSQVKYQTGQVKSRSIEISLVDAQTRVTAIHKLNNIRLDGMKISNKNNKYYKLILI